MPLTTASHDSLPYIDPPPPENGPYSLSAATALINSLLPPSHTQTLHPSLPPLPPTNLTPLAQAEQDRIAAKEPLTSIDLSRYELDSSNPSSPPSTSTPDLQQKNLQEAYTSSTYLHSRAQHLALLDKYGKNAWLVGNSQLEDLLRRTEKELAETREEVERVNGERKRVQEGAKGEMEGLERGWREGVGKVVEVEIAVADLEGRRMRVLREGGGGGR
ncbi:MAG: hypothetical protein Q9204_000944 [Flavoplaca sp. TL-2023a]